MFHIATGEEHGDPHQYSCLENSMNRGAWWALVHGVAKESDMTEQLTPHCNQISLAKPAFFSPRILVFGTRQGCPLTSFQHRSPSHSNQTRKRKSIHVGGEEVNLSLYADDIILFIDTLRTPHKTTRTDKWIQQSIRINTQKSVAFLYTNNEISERECKRNKSQNKQMGPN